MSLLPEEYSLDIYGSGESSEITNLRSKVNQYPNARYCGAISNVAEARSQALPIVIYNTFLTFSSAALSLTQETEPELIKGKWRELFNE